MDTKDDHSLHCAPRRSAVAIPEMIIDKEAKPVEPYIEKLSERSRERLAAMADYCDCELVSCDHVRFSLPKIKLVEGSIVFRSMISHVEKSNNGNKTVYPVIEEDADAVVLLVEMLLNEGDLSVTEANIDELLRLSDKFDIVGPRSACGRFVQTEVPLTPANLLRWLTLSCRYHLPAGMERCFDFVEKEACFNELSKQHGNTWYADLPGAAQARLTSSRISILEAACSSYRQCLLEEKHKNMTIGYIRPLVIKCALASTPTMDRSLLPG